MRQPIKRMPPGVIISNREAQRRGLGRYFTGKPCRHGHLMERYVGSCICVGCNQRANDQHRIAHSEKRGRDLRLMAENAERRERRRVTVMPARLDQRTYAQRMMTDEQRRAKAERQAEGYRRMDVKVELDLEAKRLLE